MQDSFFEQMIEKIKKNKKKLKQETSSVDRRVFSSNLDKNVDTLKAELGKSKDIVFHKFIIQGQYDKKWQALLVTIDGLCDEEAIRNNVLKPLNSEIFELHKDGIDKLDEKLSVYNLKKEMNIKNALYKLVQGQSLLLIEGFGEGVLIDHPAFKVRSISEPLSEQTIRGARDGFIESIATNITLLRRRISHPSLRFDSIKLGEFSQTDVSIAYIDGIADPNLISRLNQKLHQIKVDGIQSSGDIEQFIEDHPFSIFPTIGNTERPDKASAMLLEGKVLILVNGDPFVLYVPSLFIENMKNIEDYASRPYYSTFIRLLRIFAYIFSISLPAVYIAIVNFMKSTIPSDMIIPLIQARELVPFPLVVEVSLMVLMFEIVREAGVRLPAAIGAALSIVGALILGQVSVSAGLVGAPSIVIVSLSYISSFVITPIADVTALVRIALIFAASLFGGYGVLLAMLGILIHMVSLSSLGVPYMAPFAPFYFSDWKDSFIRVPSRWLRRRMQSIPNQRKTKISSLPKIGDKK